VRKLHVLLLPAVLLALALCFYACGDSDEETIASTIETALTRTNPGDCKELMTQAFLEQMMSDEGAEAVESCEQNAEAEESPNPPVEVNNVEVDGSNATADVTYTGGTFAGQTLTVALVEEDGGWKLDENIRFAKLDPSKLVNELAEGWEFGGSPAEPRVLDCIRKTLGEKSRPELEELLIGGSEPPFDEILIRCSRKR
jgi:hypothetical protein